MNHPDDKTVKPSVVDFAASAAQADQAATQPQSPAPGSQPAALPWQLENMVRLGTNLRNLLSSTLKTGPDPNYTTIAAKPVKEFAPVIAYSLDALALSDHPCWARYTLTQPPSRFLIPALESIYGADLKETGLYERAGLVGDQCDLSQALPFFPECQALLEWGKGFGQIFDSRWLALLTLPVEVRPFLAGVTQIVEPQPQTSIVEKFVQDWPLNAMMAYARTVNEVPNIHKYMTAIKVAKEAV